MEIKVPFKVKVSAKAKGCTLADVERRMSEVSSDTEEYAYLINVKKKLERER